MDELGNNFQEKERTIEYLINNPEAITLEDIVRVDNFFNNFHAKIAHRDSLLSSDNEQTRKLGQAIKTLVEGTNFDLDDFNRIMSELDKLNSVLATEIFNSDLSDAEYNKRFKENRAAAKSLIIKSNSLLLPLYKKLRALGFEHYPDLTV